MTGLVRVEARRFRYRAAVRWLAVLAVVAALAVVAGAWSSTRPPSAQAVADAREQLAWAQEDWAENGEQYLEDCRAGEEEQRATDPEVDFGCDEMEPREESYLPYRTTFTDAAGSWISGASTVLLLLAFAAGVTFVTAEIGSGSLSTWLTFVPRRGRVYASKVAVAAAGVLVPTALALLVVVGGSWAGAAANGAVGDLDGRTWTDLGLTALRVLAVSGAAGAVGAALGFVTRSAAAALGVGVGWLVVVDSLIAGFLPGLQPWTLRVGVQAWVDDGYTAFVSVPCEPLDGVVQNGVCTAERLVTGVHGGLLLLGATVLLVVVGALVFRRRDVD
ncbi:ABC transporter permease subunit [Cellulomonas sp. NPDC058312]|uniref:ABC transporter permease subunit n=1 Tax=Cellulomonas sp. NPDC058312 TaxID=3346441 RepID=UPI0036E929C2